MKTKSSGPKQRGSTLAVLLTTLVFLVPMSALAIDVAILYVVRSEAQRAADAAALAGAHAFVTSGFTSGVLSNGQMCNGSGKGLAEEVAITVATQNVVGGQPGVIQPSDIQCDFSQTKTMNGADVVVDPRITVKVTRLNLPTFFSRVWGNPIINSVSASATAEAFNESGSPQPVVSSCLKPFLLLNQDPKSSNKFVDVTNNGAITRPGSWPSGFVGEQLTLTPGDPTTPPPVAGSYYQLNFATQPTRCSCTGSQYQENIACCNPDSLQCGVSTYSVNVLTPPPQSDTVNGTQCLIHATTGGADTIDIVDGPPYQFKAGGGNPAHVGVGDPITTSDSVVTVPLFNGLSVPSSVQPIGFLQLFIQSIDTGTGNIQAVIVNVVGCAPSGTGSFAFISGGGISPVPVRLVQPGGGN